MPKNQVTKLKKTVLNEEMLLVEFKAPKKLMEAFDLKLRSRFSTRSEAIRSLIRTFLSEVTERG